MPCPNSLENCTFGVLAFGGAGAPSGVIAMIDDA